MRTTELKGSKESKNKTNLNFVIFKAMIFVLALIVTGESFAQNGRKSGGWGQGNQYGRMFDAKTVETIIGEVISVEKIVPIKGMSMGVHLMVKTNKETISVHLGPQWFLDQQDFKVIPRDKIEIKGSRITYGGKPAIIAAAIIKDNKTLLLRNLNGTPVWSGGNRR